MQDRAKAGSETSAKTLAVQIAELLAKPTSVAGIDLDVAYFAPRNGPAAYMASKADFLLPEDFLPAELRELDLLLLFFAMALVPPFLSDKFTGPSKSRQ